jgi:hypothetical protein
MARNHGPQFSISHAVWDAVAADGGSDMATVFRVVHNWIEIKERMPRLFPVATEVRRAAGKVPVVYVLPPRYRAGFLEEHRRSLLAYVRRTLQLPGGDVADETVPEMAVWPVFKKATECSGG